MANDYFNEGNSLCEQKRFEEALVSYDKALHLNSTLLNVYINKGFSLNELRRYDEAVVCYNKGLQLQLSEYIYNNMGHTLNEQQNFKQAIPLFEKAIQLKQNYSYPYHNKGLSLLGLRKYNEAISCFEQAISLEPGLYRAYNGKGLVLNALKRYEEAISHFKSTLTRNQNYANAFNNIGCTKMNQMKFDEALKFVEKAIQLLPSNAVYYVNKAIIYDAIGKYDEVLPTFDIALELCVVDKHIFENIRNVYQLEYNGTFPTCISLLEYAILSFPQLEDCLLDKRRKLKDKLIDSTIEKRLNDLIIERARRRSKERDYIAENEDLKLQISHCTKADLLLNRLAKLKSLFLEMKEKNFQIIYTHGVQLKEILFIAKITHSILLHQKVSTLKRKKFEVIFESHFKFNPFSECKKKTFFSSSKTALPSSYFIFVNSFNYSIPRLISQIQKLVYIELSIDKNNSLKDNQNYYYFRLKKKLIKIKDHYEKIISNSSRSRQIKEFVDQNFPTKPLIYEASIGCKELNDKAVKQLIPFNGLIKKNIQGHHIVISFNQIHFKCIKSSQKEVVNILGAMHGVEVIVDCLNKVVAGHGSSPTTLVKVCRGDQFNIFQAAKTVHGADLQYILEKHPEYLSYIDMDNFSAMIVLSILSNPQDGKADNFMVEIESHLSKKSSKSAQNSSPLSSSSYSPSSLSATSPLAISHSPSPTGSPLDGLTSPRVNSEARLKKLHIVGIDNDMAFGETFYKKTVRGKEEMIANVRNILYFFPQMDEKIGRKFISQFSAKQPEIILINFIYDLQLKNVGYNKLIQMEIFTEEDCNGDKRIENDKGLGIPLLLPNKLISRLFHALHEIQAYLKANPNSTHRSLLNHLQPELQSHYYDIQFNSNRNEENPYSSKSIIECIYSLYSSSIQADGELKKMNPREFHNTASQLLSKLTQTLKRDLTLSQAASELMKEIDYSKFSSKKNNSIERLIISELFSKFSSFVEVFYFNGSSIDFVQLIQYLRNCKKLKSLYISKCYSLSFQNILTIMKTFQYLRVYLNFDPIIRYSLLHSNIKSSSDDVSTYSSLHSSFNDVNQLSDNSDASYFTQTAQETYESDLDIFHNQNQTVNFNNEDNEELNNGDNGNNNDGVENEKERYYYSENIYEEQSERELVYDQEEDSDLYSNDYSYDPNNYGETISHQHSGGSPDQLIFQFDDNSQESKIEIVETVDTHYEYEDYHMCDYPDTPHILFDTVDVEYFREENSISTSQSNQHLSPSSIALRNTSQKKKSVNAIAASTSSTNILQTKRLSESLPNYHYQETLFNLFESKLISEEFQSITKKKLVLLIDQNQFTEYYNTSELLRYILIYILKSPLEYTIESIKNVFDYFFEMGDVKINQKSEVLGLPFLHIICVYFPKQKIPFNPYNNSSPSEVEGESSYEECVSLVCWLQSLVDYLVVVRNADLEAKDKSGETVLERAISAQFYILVSILLRHGPVTRTLSETLRENLQKLELFNYNFSTQI